MGNNALFHNITGSSNTALGAFALVNNTSGSGNIALGLSAGANIVGAANVICIGTAGQDVEGSTWIGNVYGVPTQSGADRAGHRVSQRPAWHSCLLRAIQEGHRHYE